MSRRSRVLKRPSILPDKNFNSVLVSRLVNRIMWDGKKTIASKVVFQALMEGAKELEITPLELIETAVNNVSPQVEVKSVRAGGASYQVPMEPYPARKLRLALTWIVNSARNIKGKPMAIKLKNILVDSYRSEGPAFAKKMSVQQTAAGNKAYAHLASRIGSRKK